MDRIYRLFIWIMFTVSFCSCGQGKTVVWPDGIPLAEDTITLEILGSIKNGVITIDKDIDLRGHKCILPPYVTLTFNGGVVKNGTLVGNNTRINGKIPYFDRVRITGLWDVPTINTTLFKDLSYDNSLKDVVALSNPSIENEIVIAKGEYFVSANENNDACIPISSNTKLTADGEIRIKPNNLNSYNIIQVKGNNVVIKGNGVIIGDKHTHTGDTGEWGMGICMKNVANVIVSGITIKDCWGDCVYIGKKSKNILIEKCELVHGRRQGVSITGGDSITISECTIKDVGGTNPQYAIDVEPNSNDSCNQIFIHNVNVENCVGGIVVTKAERKDRPSKAWIGDVIITNCSVSSTEKYPLRIRSGQYAVIEGNTFFATNEKPAVYLSDVNSVVIKGNTIKVDKNLFYSVKDGIKRATRRGKYRPIKTVRAVKEMVDDNTVVE